MFDKSEIKYLIYTSLILGFVFSFTEWGEQEFEIITGIANWMLYILIVLFSIVIHLLIQKTIAKRLGCSANLIIWKMKRFWFSPKGIFKKSIPLGYIISLFVIFYSTALSFPIKFSGVFGTKIEQKGTLFHKKFPKLTEFDQALIALSGSLSNLFLAFILAIISSLFSIEFSKFIIINLSLAIFTMLPLPSLNGIQVLFGSRVLYLMSIIFILSSYFLINTGNILLTIILSLIIAIIIGLIYFYNLNK